MDGFPSIVYSLRYSFRDPVSVRACLLDVRRGFLSGGTRRARDYFVHVYLLLYFCLLLSLSLTYTQHRCGHLLIGLWILFREGGECVW